MSLLVDETIVADVMERAKLDAEVEICGFILAGQKRPIIFEAVNVANDPRRTFEITPQEFVKASMLAPIIATYHSHPAPRDSLPSDADRRSCARSRLPMLIVALQNLGHTWVKPEADDFPLERRIYVYGVFDCYELVRDYYRTKFGIEVPMIDSTFGWWERGENLFVENFPRCGFLEIPPPAVREGDVLLIQRDDSRVPDHLAVVTGDGDILHHLGGRLSGRTLYGNFWRKRVRHAVRHRSRMIHNDVYYELGETRRWS